MSDIERTRMNWLRRGLSVLVATAFLSVAIPSASIAEDQGIEHDVYFGFYFVPKFRHDDCRISVEIQTEANLTDFEQEVGITWFHMIRYLRANRPNVAVVDLNLTPLEDDVYRLDTLFVSACDEKEDVLASFFKQMQTKNIEVKYRFLPTTDTSSSKGQVWIDSPDYDADYWRLREAAAGTCDAAKWAALAEYHGPHGAEEINIYEFVYARLAMRLGIDDRNLPRLAMRFKRQIESGAITHSDGATAYADRVLAFADRVIDHYIATERCTARQN